mmetsp:Transcript_29629/g.84500  ORF Transcript_29629/g.84500 Transcript_29629/m.84500 type:complete len:228 (+) Transcript_29629:200-883(+)
MGQHLGHQEHRQHLTRGLEHREVQIHRLLPGPAEHHGARHNEEGDLRGGAHGDAERQVHHALARGRDGGGVLRGVADDREEDQADEGLGEAVGLRQPLDGIDQDLRATSDGASRGEQHRDRGPHAQQLLRLVVVLLPAGEELGVGPQLEDQERAIDEREDNRDYPGQVRAVVRFGLGHVGEDGGQGERQRGKDEATHARARAGGVEHGGGLHHARGDEGHAHDQQQV